MEIIMIGVLKMKKKKFQSTKRDSKKMGFNLLLDESIYIKKNNQKNRINWSRKLGRWI